MRKILVFVCVISLILTVGFIGGIERDLISPGKGFATGLILSLVFGFCVYLLEVVDNK